MIQLLLYCWILGLIYMIVASGLWIFVKRTTGFARVSLWTIATLALFYGMGHAVTMYTVMYLFTGTFPQGA